MSLPIRNKISDDKVFERLIELLDTMPELAAPFPSGWGEKEFWRRLFDANDKTRRLLRLLRELPAFTEQAPERPSPEAWRELFERDGGKQTRTMFADIWKAAYSKPAERKPVMRWRDRFGPKEVIQRVRPKESDAWLPNPHRGTATFQRFQGDPLYPGWTSSDTHGPRRFRHVQIVEDNIKYIPRTTLAYCRWPWAWLEPEKGKYAWELVDESLRCAAERGQTLQVRFQPYTCRVDYSKTPPKSRRHPPDRSVNVPDWYWDTGAAWMEKGQYCEHEPDSNDPKYIEHFGDFIRAFAKRYDGHLNLESVDVAYAGMWGEGGGNASRETAAKLVDIYLDSFKKTQLVFMLGTLGCRYAFGKKGLSRRRGLGWRADCFGDLRWVDVPEVPPELCFNHTFDSYPRSIEECGVKESWRHGPVTMETCGNVATWFIGGHDLDTIIREGYRYHMSVFMPKSVFFPEEFREKLIEFDKKIGYRFALRQVRLPLECRPGARIEMEFFVDNVGCAPIYRPYRLAVRFRQEGGASGTAILKEDIRRWMPGHSYFRERVKVPGNLAKGEARVDLAIVDAMGKPRVWFALDEKTGDGWHPLTGIDII